MKKVFVYPVGNPAKSNAKNPYIFDMLNSISKHYILVNKPNCYTKYGVCDALLNLKKTDVFLFNWTENIPDRKFGFLQVIIFSLSILIIKLSSKEFIWVLHNKANHNGDKILSRVTMYLSALFSIKIITHASDGITYLEEKYGTKVKSKAQYIPHPTNWEEFKFITSMLNKSYSLQYDFIIWGAINKYKGIYEFLDYISVDETWKDKKILICGKCSDKDYLNALKELCTNNITIIEGYIDNNYLNELIAKSKSILFVYSSYSVLSSGALIKSLYYNKSIIGPNTGAFKDLSKEELVMTYGTFDEILRVEKLFKTNENKIEAFIYENQWDNSISKIIE